MRGMKKAFIALSILVGSLGLSGNAFADANIGDAEYNPICSRSDIDAEQRAAAGCDDGDKSIADNIVLGIDLVIGVIGLIAVIMIVVGGQRLITASGEPGQINQAKNMILWSVVAVIVATLSWAIVNFVVEQVDNNANNGGTSTSEESSE